jgi:hypothetical protein
MRLMRESRLFWPLAILALSAAVIVPLAVPARAEAQ